MCIVWCCVGYVVQLRKNFAHCPPEFPPRAIFPLRAGVIAQRRIDLQAFLKDVFTDTALGSCVESLRFVGLIEGIDKHE